MGFDFEISNFNCCKFSTLAWFSDPRSQISQKDGTEVRNLCWSGERSQDDQEHPEGQAQQVQGEADQAQQVRA